MGNYRSRPRSTCAEELLKRIVQNYTLLQDKIHQDLNIDLDNLTDLQRICCDGTVEKLASVLNSEFLNERLDNGMTLMHLCCVAAVKYKPDHLQGDMNRNEYELEVKNRYERRIEYDKEVRRRNEAREKREKKENRMKGRRNERERERERKRKEEEEEKRRRNEKEMEIKRRNEREIEIERRRNEREIGRKYEEEEEEEEEEMRNEREMEIDGRLIKIAPHVLQLIKNKVKNEISLKGNELKEKSLKINENKSELKEKSPKINENKSELKEKSPKINENKSEVKEKSLKNENKNEIREKSLKINEAKNDIEIYDSDISPTDKISLKNSDNKTDLEKIQLKLTENITDFDNLDKTGSDKRDKMQKQSPENLDLDNMKKDKNRMKVGENKSELDISQRKSDKIHKLSKSKSEMDLTQLRQNDNMVEFDRISPRIDKKSPQIDRISPKLDRKSPRMDRISPKMDRMQVLTDNGVDGDRKLEIIEDRDGDSEDRDEDSDKIELYITEDSEDNGMDKISRREDAARDKTLPKYDKIQLRQNEDIEENGKDKINRRSPREDGGRDKSLPKYDKIQLRQNEDIEENGKKKISRKSPREDGGMDKTLPIYDKIQLRQNESRAEIENQNRRSPKDEMGREKDKFNPKLYEMDKIQFKFEGIDKNEMDRRSPKDDLTRERDKIQLKINENGSEIETVNRRSPKIDGNRSEIESVNRRSPKDDVGWEQRDRRSPKDDLGWDQREQLRLLLQKGADPAIISKNGFSPLHLAAYKGDVDLVRMLVEKCVHVDHTGAGSVTTLHVACLAGHLEVTQALAQRGANIEARDAVSFSPLHIACMFGHEAVVEYLLSRGVDVNISGSVGDRPLHLAANRGHYRVVQMLLKKGARARQQDEEGNTPLHYCVRIGHFGILNLLLQPQYRNDAHIANVYLDTPLHTACYEGWFECSKTLLTYGGSSLLLKENLWGETILHAACTGGQCIDLIDYLLSQDATYVNYQGVDGHTPLHSACHNGHTRVVQLLLSHGADTNLCAHNHHHIVNHHRPESNLIALHRPHQYEKKVQTQDEQTPLLWAYEQGHDDIANILKHFRRPGLHEDIARGDYLAGLDTSYFPIPSPLGKLRTMIQEKIDVLHLRSVLPPHLHLNLSEIESLENIDSGSFGKVYKGLYNDKIVAVKRYRANLLYGKSDVEMFCREVSVLGSLDSPYIVKFIGACLHDPSQFAIVTEYVSGGSLFSTLHEHKRSIDTLTRFSIALDVARGMHYLHTLKHPIIHRDLNSHNILLSNEFRARVADFGESRFVRNIFEENMTKQPGNLRWMAPEVFTQCTRYSIKADVFSFGLCLWELMASELPFAHLKPAAAAADMAYKHSRPPLELAFPAEVYVLLEKAWHKIPEERPDFAQIIEELEALRVSQSSCKGDNEHRHPHVHMCHPSTSSSGTVTPPDTQHNTADELSGTVTQTAPSRPRSYIWNGHVTALRHRWEQEASRGQTAFKSSHPTIEELRSRLNNNGYVEGNTYQYRIAPVFTRHRKSVLQNY